MYIHENLTLCLTDCHNILSCLRLLQYGAGILWLIHGTSYRLDGRGIVVLFPVGTKLFLYLKTSQASSGAHPVTNPVGIDVSFSARKTWNHLFSRSWSRSVQRDNTNFTFCGQTVPVYRNFSNLI
jgi:hypothetical protein